MFSGGTYLRELWKQPPASWGPASVVSSVLRNRLEDWHGISWDKVGIALPMWGPGSQQDYGPGSLVGTNSGVTYQENGLYFTTDNTISFSPAPVINNPGKFTVFLTQKDVDVTFNDYIFNKTRWSIKISSSSSRRYSFGLDLFGTDIRRVWSYQPEGTTDDLVFQWSGDTDLPSGLGVLNFYRNREIQTPDSTTALSGGTIQDDSAYNLNIGNLTKTFMTSFVMIKDVLSQDKIAEFDANALFQPPVFTSYFIPSGIPVINYPANDDTNISQPIAFSWSSVTGAVNYQLQIADTEAGLDTLPEVDTTITAPTTTKEIDGLDPSTTYYSRVRAET